MRHYIEQADGEVSPSDKVAAMKSAVKKKVEKLRIKMGKLVCVANPELTDGWLEEVHKFQYQHTVHACHLHFVYAINMIFPCLHL